MVKYIHMGNNWFLHINISLASRIVYTLYKDPAKGRQIKKIFEQNICCGVESRVRFGKKFSGINIEVSVVGFVAWLEWGYYKSLRKKDGYGRRLVVISTINLILSLVQRSIIYKSSKLVEGIQTFYFYFKGYEFLILFSIHFTFIVLWD